MLLWVGVDFWQEQGNPQLNPWVPVRLKAVTPALENLCLTIQRREEVKKGREEKKKKEGKKNISLRILSSLNSVVTNSNPEVQQGDFSVTIMGTH